MLPREKKMIKIVRSGAIWAFQSMLNKNDQPKKTTSVRLINQQQPKLIVISPPEINLDVRVIQK